MSVVHRNFTLFDNHYDKTNMFVIKLYRAKVARRLCVCTSS